MTLRLKKKYKKKKLRIKTGKKIIYENKQTLILTVSQ